MSRRPAAITQAEIARALRAAKQIGADEVEVRIGVASVVFRMSPAAVQTKPLESEDDIAL